MAIPEWNEFGLLPAGIHNCQLEEIGPRFGFNGHRCKLILGLKNTVGWLETMPAIHSLVVDGSFVTDKELPGDIDAVAVIGNLPEIEQRHWVRSWQDQHILLKQQNHVDLYPTVAGHGNDFTAYFQYLRPEEALARGAPLGLLKGLLRIAR